MTLISTPSAQGFDFNNFMPFFVWIKSNYLGILGGFGAAFLPGFAKRYHDEQERRHRYEIDVAREVHKLCTEASTHSFRTFARDPEHAMSVLTDVESINRRMGKVMNQFITLWSLIPYELQRDKKKDTQKDYIHLTEMTAEIEEKRKVLEDWANRIRAGGKPR